MTRTSGLGQGGNPVRKVAVKELTRRTGLSRNTIRPALRSETAAVQVSGAAEEAGVVQGEMHRLLAVSRRTRDT